MLKHSFLFILLILAVFQVNGQKSVKLYYTKDYKAAKKEAIKEINSSNKSPSRSHVSLAQSLRMLGEYDHALVLIDSLLKEDGKDIVLLSEKVAIHEIQENYAYSFPVLNKILHLDPNNIFALNALGVHFYWFKPNNEKSEEYFFKKIENIQFCWNVSGIQ